MSVPGAGNIDWGTLPSAQRQQYLFRLIEAWQRREVPGDCKGPFDRAVVDALRLTGADVYWLWYDNVNWPKDRGELDTSSDLPLGGADLTEAHLEKAELESADLRGAILDRADLSGAALYWAHLEGAHLDGADLSGAQLDGANLIGAHLVGANLTAASFDKASLLNDAVLTDACFDQVSFDGTNLAVVEWEHVSILGDEREVGKQTDSDGKPRSHEEQVSDYKAAVRANRVLAVALKSQGIYEEADRFAYRAQVLQRHVLRLQRKYGRAFGSWLLDAVSGYGYRPMRSVAAYVLIVGVFATAYLVNAHFAAPHLTWDEALVLSISSFHGRGFFTSGITLSDTLARLAAGEAIIGLLVEITFIATFTQRFFAR